MSKPPTGVDKSYFDVMKKNALVFTGDCEELPVINKEKVKFMKRFGVTNAADVKTFCGPQIG